MSILSVFKNKKQIYHFVLPLQPVYVDCRRPMLLLWLALAAGQWLGSRTWPAWLLLIVIFCLSVFIQAAFLYRLHVISGLMIFCLVFGFVQQFYHHRPAFRESEKYGLLLSELEKSTKSVQAAQAKQSTQSAQMLIEGRVITWTDSRQGYTTVMIKRPGGHKIALRAQSDRLIYGSYIQVLATISKPTGPHNPGGFDESAWLRGKGVYLKAEPVQGTVIKQLRPPPSFSLAAWGAVRRQHMLSLTAPVLTENQQALLAAVLFSEKSWLSHQTRSQFSKAGLAHLMAVSGTHVSLLLLPVERLLMLTRLKRRRRIIMLFLILLIYGCLTGWPVSLTRAVLMNAVVLWGRFMDKPVDTLQSLSFAAFLLLLIKPDSILAVGYWLSLLATGSLLIGAAPLADKIQKKLPFMSQTLALLLAASLCAQLAVLPLSLGLSGEFTWIGLLTNLPAAFLVQGIMITSLPAFFLTWLIHITGLAEIAVSLTGAGILTETASDGTHLFNLFSAYRAGGGIQFILFRPAASFLTLLLLLADWFGNLPLPRFQQGLFLPLIWLCLMWFIFDKTGISMKLGAVFNFRAEQISVFLRRGQAVILIASFLFLGIRAWLLPPVEIWFFDVGQGDAILIQYRQGPTILIDGGPSGSGYHTLLPAFDALAVRQIDLAIATHGHDDHLGGIIDLIKMRRVKTLAFPSGLLQLNEKGLSKINASAETANETPDTISHKTASGITFKEAALNLAGSTLGVKTAWPELPASDWHVVPSLDEGSDRLVADALTAAKKTGTSVQILQGHDTITFSQQVNLQVLYPDDCCAKENTMPPALTRDKLLIQDGNTVSLQMFFQAFGSQLLLTGDCTEKVEATLTAEQRWPKTDVLKVAHHGSSQTTKPDFLAQTRPLAAVISVGQYNYYGHPANQVLTNLEEADCLVYRTDKHGAVRWQLDKQGWQLSAMLTDQKIRSRHGTEKK